MPQKRTTEWRVCVQCGDAFEIRRDIGNKFCDSACYGDSMRGIGKTTEANFWTRGVVEGDCLVWIGKRTGYGYGRVSWMGRMYAVHRLAWILTYGAIPNGLYACHRCDNPPCFKPDHLFLGTQLDNIRDAKAKGRTAVGSRNGSKTKPERMSRGPIHSAAVLEVVHRGSDHHQAKIVEAAVIEMRRRYAAGGVLQRELAAEYGISRRNVSDIIRRVLWTHV